ncbi:RAM signaling pathway, SOG2 [Metarhizium album ARSEF 1941]|uniref:RAM signaling pathway, SOG2 n=1 Tax=Metarhizium album (strain ARSEF 1941) TaxID=1081103 RepID=A0A0B2WF89_METAS|nr:RAM signaling pathway, SOG2 [Metarhizium album ARSEF 1941]KHN94581.1 RAM signaling pathway, SOG2 [Metarhizium album ARSEF 1941]
MIQSDQSQEEEKSQSLPKNLAETHCAVANLRAVMFNHCLEPRLSPAGPEASLSSDSSSGPFLPALQVLAVARKAMRDALLSEALAEQLDRAAVGLHPGVTVDLSRSAIRELPEECVDVLKDKLERLALSHNQLTSLPVRFSECTSLRYLSMRANQIREFPLSLCHLTRLEILDLGQNQLRVLPREVAKLSSLQVLSVSRNQIRELPLSLADMASLRVLKIKGNPLVFPSKELVYARAATSPEPGCRPPASYATEVAVTARIKTILQHEAMSNRAEPDVTNHLITAGDETRHPSRKRVTSGRFPVKVSGSGTSGVRCHGMGSSFPPLPFKLQCRAQSQPCKGVGRTRTNVMVEQGVGRKTSGWNPCADLAPRAAYDVSRPDEARACQHHGGPTTRRAGTELRSRSTTSADPALQRRAYVQRLSVTPKRRRVLSPVIAVVKGMLYAILQAQPVMQQVVSLICDELERRPSLQIAIHGTSCHIEVLDLEIQEHGAAAAAALESERCSPQASIVCRACQGLTGAYHSKCTLPVDGADAPADKGSARHIRTLLMLIYNCVMELLSALQSMATEWPADPGCENSTACLHLRDGSRADDADADADEPAASRHPCEATMRKCHRDLTASAPSDREPPRLGPGALPGRFNIDVSECDSDGLLEKTVVCLQASASLTLRILPTLSGQLSHGPRDADAGCRRAPTCRHVRQHWKCLGRECANAVQRTQAMKREICRVEREGGRAQPGADVWDLMISSMAAWTALAAEMVACVHKMLFLPPGTRARPKPVQEESRKKTSLAVVGSPRRDVVANATGGSDSSTALPALSSRPRTASAGPRARLAETDAGEASFLAVAFARKGVDRVEMLPACEAMPC